jgi:hypothetical protein
VELDPHKGVYVTPRRPLPPPPPPAPLHLLLLACRRPGRGVGARLAPDGDAHRCPRRPVLMYL